MITPKQALAATHHLQEASINARIAYAMSRTDDEECKTCLLNLEHHVRMAVAELGFRVEPPQFAESRLLCVDTDDRGADLVMRG
jgi:hypothetical protein